MYKKFKKGACMVATLNRAVLIGNLGADPEVRVTPSGQPVATLSVATKEGAMKEGRWEERTEWHRAVVWGKLAENAGKFLKKGSQVYLEGRLQTRSWDDAASGQKRYSTEIIVNQLQFLGGRTQQGASSSYSGDMGSDSFDASANGSSASFMAPPTSGLNGAAPSSMGTSAQLSPYDEDVPF